MQKVCTTFLNAGAAGVIAALVLSFTLAAPQQDTTLDLETSELVVEYNGSERDLINEIVQPDMTHTTTFIHDGLYYQYNKCILLHEKLENNTADFAVKCVSSEDDLIIFDKDGKNLKA